MGASNIDPGFLILISASAEGPRVARNSDP